MQAVEVGLTDLELPETQTKRGLLERIENRKALVAIAIVVLALGVRVYKLDAASLSEDETNKMFAIRAYEQGDFTANAEHPMMMKMLCYSSVKASDLFNSTLGARLGLSVSAEFALRLPNAVFGALTVVPLLVFASALFGFRVGLIATFMWAFGLNAVWINRVVKEDTLLVFFMLAGFCLYNSAKARPASDVAGQERLYALAGTAFGLMLASKYFPHYFGLAVLSYHLAGYDSRNNRARTGRMTAYFFGAMLLSFVIFNPAVLIPQTWRYLIHYLSEDLQTHHGYLVMRTVYENDLTSMPNGTPWYFYLLFLAVKVPLPVLIAFAIGLVEVFRRRGPAEHARGYLFLRLMLFFWLFPMSVAGSKFLRYALSLMPLVYMTAAVAISLIWERLTLALRRISLQAFPARIAATAGIAIVFLAVPALSAMTNLPYPSLYLNAFGGNRQGYFFPHDEYYDLGARESIRYLAETAPYGASIASEIPGVVQYYLERYGRTDIHSEIISHPDFSLDARPPNYVLLQRGRVYFENQDEFKQIEENYPVIQASTYLGADAVRIYSLDRRAAASLSEPRPPSLY